MPSSRLLFRQIAPADDAVNRASLQRLLVRGNSSRSFSRLFAQVCLFLVLLLADDRLTTAQEATSLRATAVAAQLDALRPTVAEAVTTPLRTNTFRTSYTTAWRQFEDAAIDALCELLPRHVPGLNPGHFDRGRSGREKNRAADLAITLPDGTIEISIKSARGSANPENDLGTFREHPNRKRAFTASFTLWVRYGDNEGAIRAERVFFDRSWRFVGKSSLVDGVKYRKKDGNMRPKPWAMFDSGEAYWTSETEFEAAVKRAELYRANELIKEYLDDLSESDQRLLYERLRLQFAEPPPPKR